MNNFQLYRTNVLLGGQMKWDLVLNSAYNKLYISDFHLTPISNNAPYTYKTDENLIYNSHQDNVKAYYTENKGIFYKEYLNTEFTHNWPIICKEGETVKAYSNIYDMGCTRSKYFNKYNKQFEFLCPVWLENLNDTLKFKIEVKNINNNILGSAVLLLDKINNCDYHNKFVNYFNNYISKTNLNDDLINISFESDTATITGLNVNTGIFETKNIDDLVKNITHRERPLLETDNMIIQYYPNNEMICKQLFNFNLCFNFEDIFSKNIVKMMYGEEVKVSVYVFIGDKQLELKDFYTEYDYIPKKTYGDKLDYNANVLDYLQDNKYIEFINKNKFCQPICHWSLCDNNDYIFNVYNGFSGLCIDNNVVYENEHVYGNTPNTNLKKYNKIANNTGWINIYNINSWNDFYKYIKNADKYKTDGTFITESLTYINDIKYTDCNLFKNDNVYILGLVVNNKLLPNIIQSFNPIKLFNTSVYILKQNDLIILLTNDINNFTFAQFYKYLNDYKNDIKELDYLYKLYKLLSSKNDPSIVYLSNSLLYTNAKSLDVNTTEVDYILNNDVYNYVIRYDGKIKPTFTDKTNTIFYKDYISNNENQHLKNSIYYKYSGLNYEPLYPSIGYCAIKKINDWNWNQYPNIYVSEFKTPVSILGNNIEYKWFNESKCLILNQNINFSYTKLQTENKTLDKIVEEKIQNYYNIENNNKLQFIKNMYTYVNNWEYLNLTNIQDYVYNISLKLDLDKNN